MENREWRFVSNFVGRSIFYRFWLLFKIFVLNRPVKFNISFNSDLPVEINVYIEYMSLVA